MDAKQIARQIIALDKTAFDNNFSAINALQEHTGMIIDKFWEKSTMFPIEERKAICQWLEASKKDCEDFKKGVEDSFRKVEIVLKIK